MEKYYIEDNKGKIISVVTCIKCKKVRKIYAKGLCKYCWNKKYFNINKQKDYSKKWREKNPNYFKDYYQRNKCQKS